MYKRLLVAVDGSEQSYKALDHAVAIAKKFGSELILLSVVPKIPFFLDDHHGVSPTIYIDLEQSHEKLKAVYKEALTHAEAKVRSKHPNLNIRTILREGRPSDTIVDVAEREGCDMIVMGSRGIGGIKGWLLARAHRVYSPAFDEEGFKLHVAKAVISKLSDMWPDATREALTNLA